MHETVQVPDYGSGRENLSFALQELILIDIRRYLIQKQRNSLFKNITLRFSVKLFIANIPGTFLSSLNMRNLSYFLKTISFPLISTRVLIKHFC